MLQELSQHKLLMALIVSIIFLQIGSYSKLDHLRDEAEKINKVYQEKAKKAANRIKQLELGIKDKENEIKIDSIVIEHAIRAKDTGTIHDQLRKWRFNRQRKGKH